MVHDGVRESLDSSTAISGTQGLASGPPVPSAGTPQSDVSEIPQIPSESC